MPEGEDEGLRVDIVVRRGNELGFATQGWVNGPGRVVAAPGSRVQRLEEEPLEVQSSDEVEGVGGLAGEKRSQGCHVQRVRWDAGRTSILSMGKKKLRGL